MKNLTLLSKYRSEILGFAILWVFFFHMLPYNTDNKYDILKLFTSFGYVGVDIFLFMSGFGLFHGFGKYHSKKQFYKKRFIRIIPTYIFFIFLTCLLSQNFNLLYFTSLFFDLGWYFPNSNLPNYNWYMSAIILFYLIFPFYITIFKKKPLKATIVAIIFSTLLTFLLAAMGSKNTAIVTTRFSIFSIGIYVSNLLLHGSTNINAKKIINFSLLFLLPTILFIKIPWSPDLKRMLMWEYGFYWIPFIIVTPGLIFLLTILFEKISKSYPQVLSILNFLGTISLEIYLIHVNSELLALIKSFSPNQSNYFINVFMISIIGGMCIHKFMKRVIYNN